MNLKRLLLLVATLGITGAAIADTFNYTWTGSESTRLGRLFRNSMPTIRRNIVKSFPGMALEASTFRWIELSFTNPYTTGPAVATIYTNDQYDTTHLTAYAGNGPGSGTMSVNYIGDQGASTPGVWAVLVPSGQALVVHACSTTTNGNLGTTFNGGVIWSQPSPTRDHLESSDAPSLLPGQPISGTGVMTGISGNLEDGDDVDLYKIRITEPASFVASTTGLARGTDTQLFLFDSTGHGVTFNDQTATDESAITGRFVTTPGIYYLAISQYDKDAADTSGNELWMDFSPDPLVDYYGQRMPDGPGAVNPLSQWVSVGGAGGAYIVDIQGATWVQSAVTQDSVTLNPGIVIGGMPADIDMSDDLYYTLRPGVVLSSSQSPIVLTWIGHAPGNNPSELSSAVETRAQQANIRQTIEVFNYSSSSYEQLDQRVLTTTTPDTMVNSNIGNPVQHLGPGNEVKLRISYKSVGPILSYPWRIFMDQVIENYTP